MITVNYLNGESTYDSLRNEVKEELDRWIAKHIQPRKQFNWVQSSYGLKHVFEADTGFYVTNGQFKEAMLKNGFEPHSATSLNWHYRIKPVK